MFLYLTRSLKFRNVRCVFFSFPETSNWTFSPPLRCKNPVNYRHFKVKKSVWVEHKLCRVGLIECLSEKLSLTCQKFWGAASAERSRGSAQTAVQLSCCGGGGAPQTHVGTWHIHWTFSRINELKKVSSSVLALCCWVKDQIKHTSGLITGK